MEQVADNPALLKLMLEDTHRAPDIYRPTNLRVFFNKSFLPELERHGLYDFRRRKNSVLTNFGATDLIPTSNDIEHTRQVMFDFVLRDGEKAGARLVSELEVSLAGNPEDVFIVGGKAYTTSILYYYLRYTYCSNHLAFNDIEVIVDLGSGAGKQVEVIKKLHPNISFMLFDIPPQLYVCEQYLTSVFPESVVSYRNTRDMDVVPELQKGKIYIFGNWKFPILEQATIDLFWNAASFQEMEPDVVANYLTYVNREAQNVFLQEVMGGCRVAERKGEHGVCKQAKLKNYKKGLTNFKIVDISETLVAPGMEKNWGYSDSFWKRIR